MLQRVIVNNRILISPYTKVQYDIYTEKKFLLRICIGNKAYKNRSLFSSRRVRKKKVHTRKVQTFKVLLASSLALNRNVLFLQRVRSKNALYTHFHLCN